MIYSAHTAPYEFHLLHGSDCLPHTVSVLEIGFSRPPAGRTVGPRLRGDYLLHFLTAGQAQFNGRPVHAGEGFLICPGHVHTFCAASAAGFSHFWIGFRGAEVAELLRRGGLPDEPVIFPFRAPEAAEAHIVQFFAQAEPVNDLRLLSELYYMLSLCSGAQPAPPTGEAEYVHAALRLIHLHYAMPFRIAELAAWVGVSAKYLCRIFHRQTGFSPKEYLTRYRLAQAEILLRDPGLPVAVAAQSVGYADALEFSQIYRKYRGCSPSRARQAGFRFCVETQNLTECAKFDSSPNACGQPLDPIPRRI